MEPVLLPLRLLSLLVLAGLSACAVPTAGLSKTPVAEPTKSTTDGLIKTSAAAPVALGGLAYHSLLWQVKIAALPAGMTAVQLHQALQQRLDALEATLSTYQPQSELMRFNRAPVGEWVKVSPELLHCAETAIAVSQLTQGAYDVTVGPLVELWGFGTAAPPLRKPEDAALAQARTRVGWQYLGIDAGHSSLQRRRDIRVDFSSLGEGAGVDELAKHLESVGVHDYLVSVAGTSRMSGHRPDGRPWALAIETPDGSGLPGYPLRLLQQVVSTSGSYRNYREVDGQRYSHTIDPATGAPVTHHGVSVTVVLPAAAGATRADALATAFNVLGPERGLALADEKGIAVFYIEKAEGGFQARWSRDFSLYLADTDAGQVGR